MPEAMQGLKYLDEVIQVPDPDAYFWTRELVRLEGIFVGISSGAALAAALEYGKRARAGENVLILLPDSGVKYLSKAFNEDWLREHGLLDTAVRGTGGDILAWKGREVVTASPRSTVQEVVHKMQERGISQVPVVEGDEPIGIVTESDLVSALCAGGIQADDPIEKIVSKRFAIVEAHDLLATLPQMMPRVDIVLVREQGKIAGVVTKIDLLTHMTERSKA